MADADSNCAVAIEYVERQYVLYTLNHVVRAPGAIGTPLKAGSQHYSVLDNVITAHDNGMGRRQPYLRRNPSRFARYPPRRIGGV
jgi:hypothetical protein